MTLQPCTVRQSKLDPVAMRQSTWRWEGGKEIQYLLNGLSVGDEVLTNGGIAGKVVKLPDNKEYVMVNVGGEVVMQMKRNYIVAVLPKGTIESM